MTNVVTGEEVARYEAFWYSACETLENDSMWHVIAEVCTVADTDYFLSLRKELKRFMGLDKHAICETFVATLRHQRAVPMVNWEYMRTLNIVGFTQSMISDHHYHLYIECLDVFQAMMYGSIPVGSREDMGILKKDKSVTHCAQIGKTIHTFFEEMSIDELRGVWSTTPYPFREGVRSQMCALANERLTDFWNKYVRERRHGTVQG